MIIVEQDLINLNEQTQVYRITETGAIIQTIGSGDMTKAVYDPTAVGGDAFDMENMVEGATNKIFTATERTKLGAVDLDTFTGELLGYDEGEITPVFTAGALSLNYGADTTANIIELPSLTQNSVLTFTGTLTKNKPVTLSTPPDTGGPWTLSVTANAKTKLLTRNGGGTATEELFLIRSNGTDLRHADGGGVVWSEGV